MMNNLSDIFDRCRLETDAFISGAVKNAYKRGKEIGYSDCQNSVENKCRKLGIDYTLIFTEESND